VVALVHVGDDDGAHGNSPEITEAPSNKPSNAKQGYTPTPHHQRDVGPSIPDSQPTEKHPQADNDYDEIHRLLPWAVLFAECTLVDRD
jgi:hypothetical protein